MRERRTLRDVTWAIALLALGCTGTVGPSGDNDDNTPTDPSMPGGRTPRGDDGTPPVGTTTPPPSTTPIVQPPKRLEAAAPARIRRLTPLEIRNSIRDVFFPGGTFDAAFPTETTTKGFDNQYDNLTVTDQFAEAVQEAAEKAGQQVSRTLATVHPCDARTKGDAVCAAEFVDTFGVRVFRKPVSAAQKQRLVEVFTASTKRGNDYATSIGAVVESMLQSPAFLFRTEYGTPTAGSTLSALTPYETASAMSYFLWGSTPDAALLTAARTGKLSSPADIVTQARRLLQDDRAKATMRHFFAEWMELVPPENMTKLDKAFNAALARSFTAEAQAFVDQVLWTGDATLRTLLTSTATSINADLARIYGATAPTGTTLQPAMLDATQRSGFITQAAFLAAHTPAGGSNPMSLGHWFRTRLFCQTLPPPPPGIPPAPDNAQLSTRERLARHRNDPSCEGCHRLIDPIGFGLERYDTLGRYRTTENGAALTGEGELVSTDVDGKFVGAVELAKKTMASKRAQDCFAGQMLEYLLGRPAGAEERRLKIDQDSIAALTAGAFKGGDVKELIVAALTSDAFLYRDTTGIPTVGGAP